MISPEGFARVSRSHNLLSLKSLSRLVDPVALGRSEAPWAHGLCGMAAGLARRAGVPGRR